MCEYTLKAHGNGNDAFHFRQWKIEGSNDLSQWEILDERNTDEMILAWTTKTFKCSSSNVSRFHQYIRMTQTGKNSGGTLLEALRGPCFNFINFVIPLSSTIL
jgi:hypothetical protein